MVKDNYDTSLNQTYLLIITPEGVDPNSISHDSDNFTMGGAVCVHPDGLLISCSRNFTPNCHVRARRYSENGFRHLVTLQVYPKFDLALGWLSKHSPDETFPHVPLTDGVNVVPGEEIFSLIHAGRLPHSFVRGHSSYDLPKDVPVPKIGERNPVGPTTFAEVDKKEKERYDLAEYRAVGIFLDDDDDSEDDEADEDDEEKECVEDLMGMHPDMPLVQGDGLMSASDSAGCPVFKEQGRMLVGIMSFSKSDFQWIIPVQVISRFVEHLLGPVAEIVRPATLAA